MFKKIIALTTLSFVYFSFTGMPADAARNFNTTRSNRDRGGFIYKGDYFYCQSNQEYSNGDYEYSPNKGCVIVSKKMSVTERHNWLCKYDPEFCAFFGIPPTLD